MRSCGQLRYLLTFELPRPRLAVPTLDSCLIQNDPAGRTTAEPKALIELTSAQAHLSLSVHDPTWQPLNSNNNNHL